MFSVTSSFIYPQNILPISSYLLSQCSVRTARHHKICSSKQSKTIHEFSGKYFRDLSLTDSFDQILSLQGNIRYDTISKFASEEVRNLILDGKVFKKSRLEKYLQNVYLKVLETGKRSCYQSHASYSSFEENKRESSLPNGRTNFLLKRILSQRSQLLVNSVFLSQLGSVRHFRTERSEKRRIKRKFEELEERNNVEEYQQEGDKPETQQLAQDSQNKLRGLLKEATPHSQTRLKLAFAEGYLASDGKPKVEEKKSRLRKYFDRFLSIVLIGSIIFGTFLIILMSQIGNSSFSIHIAGKNEVFPEEINVTFEDVKGSEEAKQELQEIVDFLKNPQKYTSLGAELPCGVLLVGPPGTGKTLLARAVAGEAGVPFFHAAGSEFDEILVGQGAKRVRQLFATAKQRAPCVVFIDEIDSVGAKRSSSVLHPYANQTINQLLSEMDGFHKADGVIVLGATNRRQDLDKALLRPGRFDVEVQVPIPDLKGRVEILNYYLDKVKLGKDIDVNVLGRGTTGFTGADLKNIVNQAALRAAADELEYVSMKHLEESRDKVLMGPERKTRIPDQEANLVTAFHESGHTLVSYFTKDSTPLHKVTIIPRGPSLGHTAFIPSKEQYHLTKSQMMASMDSLMGGRVAEELIFGPEKVTMGAGDDLQKATNIARSMVKSFGLSEKVGVRSFVEETEPFMGGDNASMSDQTKELIDGEIKRLLQESYDRAKSILKSHHSELKALADALMRYETLDFEDIKAILDGKPLDKGSQ